MVLHCAWAALFVPEDEAWPPHRQQQLLQLVLHSCRYETHLCSCSSSSLRGGTAGVQASVDLRAIALAAVLRRSRTSRLQEPELHGQRGSAGCERGGQGF